MTIIYLVRHGKTAWTGQRLIGSTPGVHLDEKGSVQAERIADLLVKSPIKAIFSSPFERAIETASPLAERLTLNVAPLDCLKEIDFGDLRGLGRELSSNPFWTEFLVHPASVEFPNGESVQAAQNRIVDGLNDLSSRFSSSDPVVCFSHCEILRLAVAFALKIPLDEYMRLTIDPASISLLEWTTNHQVVSILNLSSDIRSIF
jgi:probable phosphoglycerate mutase